MKQIYPKANLNNLIIVAMSFIMFCHSLIGIRVEINYFYLFSNILFVWYLLTIVIMAKKYSAHIVYIVSAVFALCLCCPNR